MAGPGSIVNPYTGMLPASASVAPTQAPPQAPQIVKLPVNMEIERNRAAAGESLIYANYQLNGLLMSIVWNRLLPESNQCHPS